MLQRALAAHGQRLALDPPWADRATVGGVVASNAFGALRTRYGSIRDLIIGISFVRADGARVRGGGKVVKNVAGFDLPKLLTGSLGTLGLIATATFRLHPLPETASTVVFPRIALADAQRVLRAAREAHLEPEAVAALASAPASADWQLGVRFAGFARGVADQTARLREAVHKIDIAIAMEAESHGGFWDAHERARASDAAIRIKVALLPADPGADRAPRAPRRAAARRARDLLSDAGAGLRERRQRRRRRGRDRGRDRSRAPHARRDAAAAWSCTTRPRRVRARLDVWGVAGGPRSAVPLMRNLKQRLDPERRLAPGRFVAGL